MANEALHPLIGKRNVLLLDGEEHLARRKLVLPPLHGGRMRAYGPVVAESRAPAVRVDAEDRAQDDVERDGLHPGTATCATSW